MRKHLSSWHLPWLHVRKDIRRGKQTQKQGKRVFCLKSLKIYAFDHYDNLNVYITWRTCNMICFKFPHLQFGDLFLPIDFLQLYVIHIKGKPCAIYCRSTSMHPGFFGAFRTHQDFERKKISWNARRPNSQNRSGHRWPLRAGVVEKGTPVFSNGSFSSSIQRSKGPPKIYNYYKYAACI